jgi:predicted DNA-binding transcriptional regulator AlpA
MRKRFYRVRDLCGTQESRKTGERGMLGFSHTHLYRLVREGQFPAPVRLSSNITAFDADAVDAWMAARPRAIEQRAS